MNLILSKESLVFFFEKETSHTKHNTYTDRMRRNLGEEKLWREE